MRARLSILSVFFVVFVIFVMDARAQAEQQSVHKNKSRIYVGTHAKDRQGIYQAEFDSTTGEIIIVGLACEVDNPLYLALHPNRKYLYSTCDLDKNLKPGSGSIAGFKIDALTGDLTLLNHQASKGAVPCHISFDREGKYALVANYLGGNAAVLPISADGKLKPATAIVQHQGSSIHPTRQTSPHPHSIHLDPANKFAFVADAGTDELWLYEFDIKIGELTPKSPAMHKFPAGAAPRHLVFHSQKNWAYVINELDNTITMLGYESMFGVFETRQTISTLPTGNMVDNMTAEIIVHPNGNFLYGSNRGHDSIAIFSIDANTGQLTSLGQIPAGGKNPRSIAIDPTAKFLLSAHQDSGNIVVHRIDQASGKLIGTQHKIDLPKPTCVVFVPQ